LRKLLYNHHHQKGNATHRYLGILSGVGWKFFAAVSMEKVRDWGKEKVILIASFPLFSTERGRRKSPY
jgi:hypothetical protein